MYGRGEPGKTVTVGVIDPSGDNGGPEQATVNVDADGAWRIVSSSMAAI